MPQLTFPVVPNGLCVDVFINFDAEILLPLDSSAQARPEPLLARGLIDTGSDLTVVSLPLLKQLGVSAQPSVLTEGISGLVQADTYLVSLHVLHFDDLTGPWLSRPSLRVMGLTLGSRFDVLIGMDVLLNCRFLLDGPNRQFSLEW